MCGFSPAGVSQALNPALEAFGLPRHKTGVMKGMSQDRNALHRRKQVHGKALGVLPLPECPKLALDPGQELSEDFGRSRRDRAARLVELGAKTSRPAQPCSAKKSLFSKTSWTQAQSRSLGDLASFHRCRCADSSASLSSTIASPISSLVLK